MQVWTQLWNNYALAYLDVAVVKVEYYNNAIIRHDNNTHYASTIF